MTCDDALAVLSAVHDGEAELADDVEAHVATCPQCQRAVEGWSALRQQLRAPGPTADIASAVLGRISRPRRVRLLPLVAAAVAGLLAGSLLVSGRPGRGPEVVSAAIPAQVLAAQTRLQALTATVDVVERAWHPAVDVRNYRGTLAYAAPEQLELSLRDVTEYPSSQWVPNDVRFRVHDSSWWAVGPAPCPTEGQPRCTPPTPRVRSVIRREPFAEDASAPLDLVLPAASFAIGRTATVLEEERRFDGRRATGVVTTAGQMAALLDGLQRAGNWRPVAPTARTTVWLDRATLVPLAVDVAGGRGGRPALEIRLHDLRVNVEPTFAADAPSSGVRRDAGFVDGPVSLPTPELPRGMTAYRSGRAGAVQVASWSDGRAWVKVRADDGWTGRRLFGGLGDIVRVERLGGGVVYVAEGGRKIGIHTDDLDVVVTGSVSTDVLRQVAESLGIVGLPVPADWAEAGTSTVASAARAMPGLLVLPATSGFAPPAVRLTQEGVTLAYTGAGERGVLLVQTAGRTLPPPLDDDVTGVAVRGHRARWTQETGQLEWVEGGRVIELQTRTLSIGELVELARRLRRAT